MKLLPSILSILIVGTGWAFGELPAGWETDFTNALVLAKAKQQPVLAYFTASWCGPCKLMARTTLTNQAVIEALANYSHVAVDIDQHQNLAGKYGVRAVPTFRLLTAAGDEISATTGYQDTERFLQWLTNGLGAVKEATVQQKQFEEKLDHTDQLIRQADAASLHRAAMDLFEFCALRNKAMSQAVSDRLAVVGKRDPALLLDGLIHARLATRIQVANLLRQQLGDDFDVDPWSDTAARRAAISQWRQRLTNAKSAEAKTP